MRTTMIPPRNRPYSELRENLRRTVHDAVDLFFDADPGTVTPEAMAAYDSLIIEAIKRSRIQIPYAMPSDTIPCPPWDFEVVS